MYCIRVVYWDSRNPGSLPTLTEIFLFDVWQNDLFLHASENGVAVLLSCMNCDTPSERERYHFLFSAYRFACLYCSLCRIGTFPHHGFIECLWYNTALVQLKTSRHYWNTNIILVQLFTLGSQNYWGKVIHESSKIKSCSPPRTDKTLPTIEMSGFSHK